MQIPALRDDEWIGLGLAVVLHVALVGMLLLQPARVPPPEPQRISVSLAPDVGLFDASPDPVKEAQASIAPVLSDVPAPPSPVEAAMPEPVPAPRPVATTPPKPRTTPPKTNSASRRRPDTPSSQKQSVVRQPPKPATGGSKGGGSKLGKDFLGGMGDSTASTDTRIPASQIGNSAKASIVQAIIRQIKPHWNAPQGVDADLLVTELAFDLNPDGSLAGRPRVIRQSGINASNKPQADIHAERAIRAVVAAAPFNLPPEYYNAWKHISGARFDRNLSQ